MKKSAKKSGAVFSLLRSFVGWFRKCNGRMFGYGILAVTILLFSMAFGFTQEMLSRYKALESVVVTDRIGEVISVSQNAKGEYSAFLEGVPPRIAELLVKKEDRFFYWHPGINLGSVARSAWSLLWRGRVTGSSTITQQLAKNLLGNEGSRTLANKLKELAYSFSVELILSKDRILAMYANTVYMGNNIQGLRQASADYFGKKADDLNDSEIVSLLAALSNPSRQNPWRAGNFIAAADLAKRLEVADFTEARTVKSDTQFLHKSAAAFEFDSLGYPCVHSCETTLDKNLTDKLREILKKNVDAAWDSGARNGAIAVIKIPENEVLAVVGSPNPASVANGYSINMATSPRPIGSTAKPFIFLRAFEKGARPYTLVEDREYKYPIATGFPIYPKNYDGQYHGVVTLHQALSNSYNIPAVKTLEYVGLTDFYDFLERRLLFEPLQEIESYQYGIALGGLEMDPLTLAHYFSIFPAEGQIRPLRLFFGKEEDRAVIKTPMSRVDKESEVAEEKYTQLITRILSDRKRGVEQFGAVSNLNLSKGDYAVKTGTSRDYHDSWTVGYTPDFVVVVWLGNAENKPLKQISGSIGAGKIWNETMELLLNSQYFTGKKFDFSQTTEVMIDGNLEYGLADDEVAIARDIMRDPRLILSPHDGDRILLGEKTMVTFKAAREVTWLADGVSQGTGEIYQFRPTKAGVYEIRAEDGEKFETVSLNIVSEKN